MHFLEAMAMGKCVVAHDDATMNEYIKDGENGILFNAKEPKPVPEVSVLHVLRNVGKTAMELRAKWLEEAQCVPDFVNAMSPCRPSLANRLKITFSYPLYLAEGAKYALTGRGRDNKTGESSC